MEKAAFRRALDLVASFLSPQRDDQALAEFERLLNDDRHLGFAALYALAAIASGLVQADADRRGEDPLDVLHGLEQALEDEHASGGSDEE